LNRSVPGFQKGRMKRRIIILYTFSKEEIMVSKSQRGMNAEEVYLKEYHLPPGIKEASIIVKETTEENITVSYGMNSKELHYK
jgi:hypothetical protein